MQLWFMKRKAQVLNFWNEFSSPAKVPKVKEVKICINMIWKLEFEMHIIGVKASHFLIFFCHMEWLCIFLWRETGYSSYPHPMPCPPPTFLLCFVNILNRFLQLYFWSCEWLSKTNDTHGDAGKLQDVQVTNILIFLFIITATFESESWHTIIPYIGT